MQFRDMIGIAETGSGKTGAFLIPMLEFILRRPQEERDACSEDGPLALIMAPTRDLAIQIDEAAMELSKHCGVRTCCVVGGRDIGEQGVQLRKGCEIVTATPMRLLDVIDQRYVLLNQATYIVLDEADRMIDMGFGPQVEAVLDSIGASTVSTAAVGEEEEGGAWGATIAAQERRKVAKEAGKAAEMAARRAGKNAAEAKEAGEAATEALMKRGKKEGMERVFHMFSATFPRTVRAIAEKYLERPITVQIGDQDSGKNKNIRQQVEVVSSEGAKLKKLISLLQKGRGRDDAVIVFINTKSQCDTISKRLRGSVRTVVLHGDKRQNEREESLRQFKSGEVGVLIATDVAGGFAREKKEERREERGERREKREEKNYHSPPPDTHTHHPGRGLDIKGVSLIVNYDMPSNRDGTGIDRYCHRIGRTGRAGRKGVAVSFVHEENDEELLPDLVAYLRSTKSEIPKELQKIIGKKEFRLD